MYHILLLQLCIICVQMNIVYMCVENVCRQTEEQKIASIEDLWNIIGDPFCVITS